MTNAELIKALRYCADETKEWCSPCPYFVWDKQKDQYGCVGEMMRDAADALEAADKRIAELEDDLLNGTISDIDRYKVYDYTVRDLILFADMCKQNDVKESDLKQAAWNLELAVRAYHNSIIEGFKEEINDKGTMYKWTLKPNFEKAFAEMRGEHDEQ